ncbi:MAG: DUF3179 domain-containing protein [Dehalococcoidia bacterium]
MIISLSRFLQRPWRGRAVAGAAAALAVVAIACGGGGGGGPPTEAGISHLGIGHLMDDLLFFEEDRSLGRFSEPPAHSIEAIREMAASGDQQFVPVLVEVLRLGFQYNDEVAQALTKLTGQDLGDDWARWAQWLGEQGEVALPPGFIAWKGRLLSFQDSRFQDFFNEAYTYRIPIHQIVWGGVARDGIPALSNPPMLTAEAAEYLSPGDPVFGICVNGDCRAYPMRILVWHELVNDVVGGEAIALPYCTLCFSAIPYRAQVGDRTFTFGTSGLLYQSNKLMFDRQTNSLWSEFTGEPVAGPLADSGIVLETLPVTFTAWQEWQTLHPDTKVLDIETGYGFEYDLPAGPYGSYFGSPGPIFPVSELDELETRLAAKDFVFALRVNGQAKAYPVLTLVEEEPVVNDAVGGVELVVVTNPQAGAMRAYERGGLQFVADSSTTVRDDQDRTWRITEEALVLDGGDQRLARLPGNIAYWFGWYSFYPETLLYDE